MVGVDVGAGVRVGTVVLVGVGGTACSPQETSEATAQTNSHAPTNASDGSLLRGKYFI